MQHIQHSQQPPYLFAPLQPARRSCPAFLPQEKTVLFSACLTYNPLSREGPCGFTVGSLWVRLGFSWVLAIPPRTNCAHTPSLSSHVHIPFSRRTFPGPLVTGLCSGAATWVGTSGCDMKICAHIDPDGHVDEGVQGIFWGDVRKAPGSETVGSRGRRKGWRG